MMRLLLLLLVLCATPQWVRACTNNDECVPATCCHATACVPKAQGPKCTDVACDTKCEPFTLDCSGKCFCTELGKCGAMVNLGESPPSPFAGGPLDFHHKKMKYTYGYTKVKGYPKHHGHG